MPKLTKIDALSMAVTFVTASGEQLKSEPVNLSEAENLERTGVLSAAEFIKWRDAVEVMLGDPGKLLPTTSTAEFSAHIRLDIDKTLTSIRSVSVNHVGQIHLIEWSRTSATSLFNFGKIEELLSTRKP
jgi:hypothetical protein